MKIESQGHTSNCHLGNPLSSRSQFHNPVVPPKIGVFAWEATWGKVLTLDQLKRRGMILVNRCFMCDEDEENIDHLMIHCKSAKMLWDLILSIFGTSWVFPQSVFHTL